MQCEAIAQLTGGAEVLVLPHIDPMRGRYKIAVGPDTTIAQMVAAAFPKLNSSARVRVVIGDDVVPPEIWGRVRPKLGTTVVVRVVPTNGDVRSILSVAVLVAAVSLGQFYAPGLAGALMPASFTGFGTATATAATLSTVGAIATAGFAVAGSLLLNALVPARGLGSNDKGSDIFAITGLQNSADPGGPVRSILGYHRYAPVYSATPYTEVIGDDQYVIAAFDFGHGPLNLYNLRLGDTPIENFADFQVELRQGFPSDAATTLYPQQVIEEQLSVKLLPASPVIRMTARDVTECCVEIAFVQGLVEIDSKGRSRYTSVGFDIRQRKIGASTFDLVQSITITDNRSKLIRRAFRWALPERGQYEIHVTRTTPDNDDTGLITRADWSAIRSYRPEAPFSFNRPTAKAVVRIRASNQLNGVINNFNADCALICKDWDVGSQTWIERETSNPASLFRHVLQGPANAYPKTDAEINIPLFQEWHEFCNAKGLQYNRVHDFAATRLEVLADIAAAGRATPHDDGVQWGVTIDRPQSTYVSAITPRNSWDFQGVTPQVQFPDGHRVQFIDETAGFQQAERVVPFPGVSPDSVAITEDLSFPGVTDPSQIWKAVRRRQYELIHRPHTYTTSQDIEALVLARGNLAALSHDVLDRDHVAARVRSISGRSVVLDTFATMEAGRGYSCSFRTSGGEILRRNVVTVPGYAGLITVVGDTDGIAQGDLAMFGTSQKGEVLDVIVKSVERGENLTAKLTLIDAAPIIDELTDAEVPPAWDGRVGEIIDVSQLVPAVPVITSITYADGLLQVAVSPGTGSAAVVETIVISHRPHGGGVFSTVSILVSDGAAFISGYLSTDSVDVKARAVSIYGVSSAESSTQVSQGFLTFDSGPTIMAPGTYYLNGDAAFISEASALRTISSSKTISELYVQSDVAPGSSAAFTYTLRMNGADTALTCIISGASATSASDGSHSVSFGSGDTVSLKLVVSSTAFQTSHSATVDAV